MHVTCITPYIRKTNAYECTRHTAHMCLACLLSPVCICPCLHERMLRACVHVHIVWAHVNKVLACRNVICFECLLKILIQIYLPLHMHRYMHACMHAWRWIVLVLARQHQGRAHTYIYTCMYVCIYMHMHTYMHIHTHTETYLYFTYHIHIPQALMYIYVYTFVYVCVSICNIIEYTRQGYIHADFTCMTTSSCM